MTWRTSGRPSFFHALLLSGRRSRKPIRRFLLSGGRRVAAGAKLPGNLISRYKTYRGPDRSSRDERSIVSHPPVFHPASSLVLTALSFSLLEAIARRLGVVSGGTNRFVYISRNRFAYDSEYFSRIPEHFASQPRPPVSLAYLASPSAEMQNIRDAIDERLEK